MKSSENVEVPKDLHQLRRVRSAQIFVDICLSSSTCMASVWSYLTCLSHNGKPVWSMAHRCFCFYVVVKDMLLKNWPFIAKEKRYRPVRSLKMFPLLASSIGTCNFSYLLSFSKLYREASEENGRLQRGYS